MQNLPNRGILESVMKSTTNMRFLLSTAALATAVLAGCTFAPQSPSESGSLDEKLQIALNELQETHHFPGATAAAILPDNSVITLSTGYADIETHRPMSPDTPQFIGDAGMSFLAALAINLDRADRIKLDTPIYRLLDVESQHAWFDSVPYARRITLRHLLTHTSGIRDTADDDPETESPAFAESLSVDTLEPIVMPNTWIERLPELKSDFRPGTGFTLSRMGYRLAGLVIEHVTGVPLKTLLADEILNQEELAHTSIGADGASIAKGYTGEGLALGDGETGIWIGNSLASTPDDLVRWTKRLYEENLFDEPYLEDLLASGYRGSQSDSQYGLGVYIYETTAGEAYGHVGNYPGYATNVIYFPRHQIGVCIQVNRSYDNDTREYVQTLAQVVLNSLPKEA